MSFIDYYAEHSCTAARPSFSLGQSVLRSGLNKVSVPGTEFGSRPENPTLARLLSQPCPR
jgi:arylsulfatase A-like enzyme